MRLSVYPNQRLCWAEFEQDCVEAVEDGWDGIWLCDHLVRPPGEPAGFFLECWTSMAALAALLPSVTIGSLVSANSLRHPGLVAVMAAGLQQISDGRFVLGLGAGGDDVEHEVLGMPFPTTGKRLDALAEACLVVRQLQTAGPAQFDGRYFRLRLAETGQVAARRPPLLIGAAGPRGLDIAAQYADRWAIWGSPAELRTAGHTLDHRCRQHGRDPHDIRRAAIVMATATVEASGDWPATLPVERSTLPGVLRDYGAAGVSELIVCDYALPRHRRRQLLRELRDVVRTGDPVSPP